MKKGYIGVGRSSSNETTDLMKGGRLWAQTCTQEECHNRHNCYGYQDNCYPATSQGKSRTQAGDLEQTLSWHSPADESCWQDWTSSLLNSRRVNFCSLSYSVHGASLRRPQETNAPYIRDVVIFS